MTINLSIIIINNRAVVKFPNPTIARLTAVTVVVIIIVVVVVVIIIVVVIIVIIVVVVVVVAKPRSLLSNVLVSQTSSIKNQSIR